MQACISGLLLLVVQVSSAVRAKVLHHDATLFVL
jgi:hypothetical protein